ncbi:MAG: hypothetical protein CMI31_14720 [Opitutae bacterium]|nr:hypothetical protein [Opitutae bacterium]|tara:strand:- start:713 stop:2032 length:1320 start_codon:yes stop_codon:yes gene_type:complete
MNKLTGSIRFKKFEEKRQSITFSKGIHIIYGESGTGKSDLLNSIQSLPTSKKVNYDLYFEQHKLKIYRIYQNPDHQIIASTISNEITFSGECDQLDPEELENIQKRGLSHLPDYIDPLMNPGYLSGGEKELLNLITGLDLDPDVLLIDDGFSFLSDTNKKKCVQMLSDWIEACNGIVIWATSEEKDLFYGDYTWVMSLDSFTISNSFSKREYGDLNIPDGNLSLDIQGLSFQYQNSREIYSNFSISIDRVRSLGLYGENGSGKTTFAGLCFGDLIPSDGEIILKINDNAKLKIGYLDQFPENLILLRTIKEQLDELKANQMFDTSLYQTFKNRLLRFGIRWEKVKDVKGIDLPWAVLRIVLIVMFCHCRFDILILDEPTFGLGWDQRKRLRSFIRESMSNIHFIIVSHDKSFIHSICDNLIDFDILKLKHLGLGTKKET